MILYLKSPTAVGKRPLAAMLGLRMRRRLNLKLKASLKAFSRKMPVRITWPETVARISFSRVARISIFAISGF